MKRSSMCLCLGLTLGACGGASAPPREPDEVTATWTAGDDAPLGDPGGATTSEKAHRSSDVDPDDLRPGDQPGGPKT